MEQNKVNLRKEQIQKKSRRARAILVLAAAGLVFLAAVRGSTAQEAAPATQPATKMTKDLVTEGTDQQGMLHLTVGKSQVIATRTPYKRVSVGEPTIADVNPIGPGTILVTAKKAGSTQLIIWDDTDRSQVVDVLVQFDMQALQQQLKEMFPTSKIEVASLNDAIALRGRVPNLDTAKQAVAVATPYAKNVLNFLEVAGGQQIMLQVRFAEMSRSATNQLGVNFNYINQAWLGGSNIGQVNPSSRLLEKGVVGDTPTPSGGVDLNGKTSVNPSVTLFGSGQLGSFYFEYFLNALRQNNLVRMLAEPNLTAISGQEARFLAGGEFPVPVTQGGATAGAVTVEYREFGVKLRMIPYVLGDGRVRLQVMPEVSDLDFTTAVRLNGFVIPGLTSRKVNTTVELAEGQTFAIAGLLNNSITANKDVTPLLGDLPVVGALFRSVRYQRKETELVVLVTPHFVEAMNPAQVPTLPGEKWRDPNDLELYFGADLGGEEVDGSGKHGATTRPSGPAPKYYGQYGFTPSTQPIAEAKD
jgi:pilus assembly protein CpaC